MVDRTLSGAPSPAGEGRGNGGATQAPTPPSAPEEVPFAGTAAGTQEAPTFNPFEPGFFDDPYSRYTRLRETDPVHKTTIGAWLVTRWADVHQILRNPRTSVEDHNSNGPNRRDALALTDPERAERGMRAILNIDPPDHTRIRRLVSKAFTPRAVEQMRPRVEQMLDGILDDVAARGEDGMDVIGEVAFPLPFLVISGMLGMPEQDSLTLRRLSHTMSQAIDPILVMTQADEIAKASDEMGEILAEAVAWKRGRPDDDDLLQALIRAEDGGDTLTDRELLDNVTLLYIAGHETTVNLIGNATLALLRNPDERRRLIADPSLDAGATDEALRYDSPVQFSRRIALEPIELEGQTIEKGAFVLTALGAANRDPDKFGPTADRLDLSRADANQHVSFGSGVHHCLGAALARLEGTTVIPRLARRFPNMELAEEPAWNGRVILRGLDHLNVTLR